MTTLRASPGKAVAETIRRVEEWMSRDVLTCRSEESLDQAAHRMWTGDCGVLPVVDAERRVVGMITDRDLCMGAHFGGQSLKERRVGDAMTHAVHSVRPADSIEEAIRRMSDRQVRRVPVVDANGKLVGLLALNDIARRLLSVGERSRARLAPRLLEALASICETRASTVPEVAPAPDPAHSARVR